MHMTEASTGFTPAPMEGHGVYNHSPRVQATAFSSAVPLLARAANAFANLGIICSAALSLLFFHGLGLARDLDGKYANSRSSSGSTASQAGEGLAAESLMARALMRWIGIQKMGNTECGLTASGSRCRPTRW